MTGSGAGLVWVDDVFLREHDVPEWVGPPMWRDYEGTWQVDAERARRAGLVCRPLAETVADTYTRFTELGVTLERETELLTAWDAHQAGD